MQVGNTVKFARVFCASLCMTGAAFAQQTWYVDIDATGEDTGLSWPDAFTDLQDALAAATNADEIWIAEGVYNPSPSDIDATFLIPRGVALYGGFAGGETNRNQRDWTVHQSELSGDIGHDDVVGSGRYWYSNWNIHSANSKHIATILNGNASTVLDGLVIKNGDATQSSGGGLYVEGGQPTIRNCRFTHNLSSWGWGGAMFLLDSNATISNCDIVENANHLTNGAGIATYGTSAPTIEDSFFQYNRVTADSNDGTGGGISHWASGEIVVARCTFDTNLAHPFYPTGQAIGYGGGIFNFTGRLTVVDSIFIKNEATFGGGVYSFGPATIVNSLFAENVAIPQPRDPYPEIGGYAAAVGTSASTGRDLFIDSCTLVNNDGKKYVGVYTTGNARTFIENSIIFHNNATDPEVIGFWRSQLNGGFDMAYSCVYKIFDPPAPGEDPIEPDKLPGVIDDEPSFVDLSNSADLHLAPGSPCIDAGDNAAVPPDVDFDLDGEPRFMDDPDTIDTGNGTAPIVDMGCYEYPGVGGIGATLSVSPDPLIAGQAGTFTVNNATAHAPTFLAYSLKGQGTTFVPQLNITLDLRQPKQAGNAKRTDANGDVEWRLPIPKNVGGRNVWFQAAQFENKSNLVATSIQ